MVNPKTRLFGISFLILFLELALIRLLPAQISYLGYFSNFILLACFCGIGIGILLAKNRWDLIWVFPWLLLFLIFIISFFPISVAPALNGEIHFTSNLTGLVIPQIVIIPVVFLLTVVLFSLLSQQMGRLLNSLPPLTAYTWDILGSLTGIIVFTLMSFLQTGPVGWLLVFMGVFLLLNRETSKRFLATSVVFTVTLVIISVATFGAFWSPYQKITVYQIKNPGNQNQIDGYFLYVNNIAHQEIVRDLSKKEWIYEVPYQVIKTASFNRVLIIGAGTGSDTSIALTHNVRHIDAVEIDPVILGLGKLINFNHPYQDPRVTAYVDDARSFLQKNQSKYDLIIFGLPDSLVLASSQGNLRLESFLFTKEALQSAKNHLTPGGKLVLYNYYRQTWLVEKLGGMLKEVFGETPYIQSQGPPYNLAVLITGVPASQTLSPALVPATDNWPFLYLKKPSVPAIYLYMFFGIGVGMYFCLSKLTGKSLSGFLKPSYFFLGAGFFLLETKNVVQFSLLFGATWLTNALVFFAILSSVLLAIKIISLPYQVKIKWLYLGLIVTLIIQWLTPPDLFLGLQNIYRYLLVSLITFSPVLFAEVIFARTFKDSRNNSFNFASNMFGAVLGGGLEYLALLIGYQNLSAVVIVCYLAAFLGPN